MLSALLDAAGASGDEVEITALNDYRASIPIADIRRLPIILATRRNGETMPVRERGPYWVIYPMDKDPTLRNDAVYARSVWQAVHITVH